MTDEIAIPPVEAGEFETSIDMGWNNWPARKRRWEATAFHQWTFDVSAYARVTGLDIGADYPRVPQENGHTLRIEREFRWPNTTDTDYTPITVEETWYTDFHDREVVRHDSADIETDDDGFVTDIYTDPDGLFDWLSEGRWIGKPWTFVRYYHNGHYTDASLPRRQMRELIKLDSPDEARVAGGYVPATFEREAKTGD